MDMGIGVAVGCYVLIRTTPGFATTVLYASNDALVHYILDEDVAFISIPVVV